MPAARRVRASPAEDWEALQLRLRWPEQTDYELIPLVVVFGLTPAARAAQTGAGARTTCQQGPGETAVKLTLKRSGGNA